MAICISCGHASEKYLCDKCIEIINIDDLCSDIMNYKHGFGRNVLWDGMPPELFNYNNRENVLFKITADMDSPKREYLRILYTSGGMNNVAKANRQWLYEAYEVCRENAGLSEWELNRVKGLVIDALYKDYFFAEADELANEVLGSEELPKQAYMTLADFYIKTRRYGQADKVITKAEKLFAEDEHALKELHKLTEYNNNQMAKADSGKRVYMPAPKEHKEEIQQRYIDFLTSVGINAEISAENGKTGNIYFNAKPTPGKTPKPIPKRLYPEPSEIKETDFDSFVSFDLETTGYSSVYESIIEIGAIKVVNGQITESKEFIFQEFVKPFQRTLSEKIQQLTGITLEDVKDAREMWQVIPDFMEFAGDNILLGYNCVGFDSRFMVRAGRYSNIIIKNKYFDVMKYADKFKRQMGLGGKRISLAKLSEALDITNPRAHRALADAITTAKVYLKLKEIDTQQRQHVNKASRI